MVVVVVVVVVVVIVAVLVGSFYLRSSSTRGQSLISEKNPTSFVLCG